MKIVEYKTFSWQEIEEMKITKTELAKLIGIDCSYDAALPHEWLTPFVEKHGLEYHQVIYSSFMVYTAGDYFGTVYSACDVIQKAMNKDKIEWIADELADKYAQSITDDLKRLCGVDIGAGRSELSSLLIKTLTLMELTEK
jgi:hypothetical protein